MKYDYMENLKEDIKDYINENKEYLEGKNEEELYDFCEDNYDEIIDYFIMNLLIRVLYEDVDEVKVLIDSVDDNNPNLYKLNEELNNQFSESRWKALRQDIPFHRRNPH